MRLAKNEALIILGLVFLLVGLVIPAIAGHGWGGTGHGSWGCRHGYGFGQMPGKDLTAE